MITFSRTNDIALVRRIMTHPKVWPGITDDSAPPREQFQPVDPAILWYVVIRDAEELLGLWVLAPQTGICCEIHTCLLPNAWGARGGEAAREMARWIWGNTPFKRIFTNVPSFNRLALHFAERAGMTRFGVNQASFQKHGILYDQILLGLSPE